MAASTPEDVLPMLTE